MRGGTIGGENSSDGNKLLPGNLIGGPWFNTGGGGVSVSDGSFDMHNGIIQSNSGGGVGVGDKGSFTMYGGAIKGNTVYSGGGGVTNGGTFNMNGGIIKENKVDSGGIAPFPDTFHFGGGVYNSGTFIMNSADAVIEGNTVEIASTGGAGVGNSGTFIMNAGTIKRNRGPKETFGTIAGGVFNENGTFTMNDGTIGGGPGDANIAGPTYDCANGVGGYNSTFIMTGGIITGNIDEDASKNYGVYWTNGEGVQMAGSAQITEDNMVYLSTNVIITIDGNLDYSPAANITTFMYEDNFVGTKLLKASSSELFMENYKKFLFNGESGHINSNPEYDGEFWYYGVYQKKQD
jgi:hypothetical protein